MPDIRQFCRLIHKWLQLNLCMLCYINDMKYDLFLLMTNSGDNDIFHFYLDYREHRTILVDFKERIYLHVSCELPVFLIMNKPGNFNLNETVMLILRLR